ncbi:MAG: hypothetical protein KC410_15135 [Anaerolineales bacterium]|uniref:hypothetical protein n=1 Tax=Promineifilum sp. TaxID=2664178 RepID=UPI001DFD4AA5|nr:hypothetical protein [Anaerolineales bacterium]MCB8935065.1 hypothetical protein [Promineifilum sp.]MCO5181062.1 hypothetical protein [Promineifilum sp.]
MDKNEHVVVAVFEDRAAAETAIEHMKKWDKASDDIKLGAIGLLYKEGGEVKSVIGHQMGRGAKVGALVGIITGVLTGGVGLVGGAAAGGLLGGATGAFFAKSLHLNEAECNALGMELELGKAAVVVTCDEYEVTPVRSTLEHAGGAIRVYVVPVDAVDAAAAYFSESKLDDIREAEMVQRAIDDSITKVANDFGGMI